MKFNVKKEDTDPNTVQVVESDPAASEPEPEPEPEPETQATTEVVSDKAKRGPGRPPKQERQVV